MRAVTISSHGFRTLCRIGWCGAALAVCLASPVAAQYALDWYTIDGGGVSRASTSIYRLSGTIGQPDAGQLSGGTSVLKGAFWRGGLNLVAVEEPAGATVVPVAFGLHASAPNPLIRNTTVAFDLPLGRSVQLRVYDANGRITRTLVDGSLSAGRHQRSWDASDDAGLRVPAGIYFIRLETETDRATRKIAVLR